MEDGKFPNRDYGGHWTDILHQKFADYTKSQLHNAIKIASAGRAHVVLLTTPCFDSGTFPDGKGYPEDNPTRIRTYNDMLYQAATSDPMVSGRGLVRDGVSQREMFVEHSTASLFALPTAFISPWPAGISWRPRSFRQSRSWGVRTREIP